MDGGRAEKRCEERWTGLIGSWPQLKVRIQVERVDILRGRDLGGEGREGGVCRMIPYHVRV